MFTFPSHIRPILLKISAVDGILMFLVKSTIEKSMAMEFFRLPALEGESLSFLNHCIMQWNSEYWCYGFWYLIKKFGFLQGRTW
jgi:hypothetical protein